jgi:hypothetical protein
VLDGLRAQYSLGKAFHFRFTKASKFIKPKFFAAVGTLDLDGVVLRVDKSRLGLEARRRRGIELLAYFAADTICRMRAIEAEDHALIFDGLHAERALTQALRVAISATMRENGLPALKRLAARPAQREAGLQVADMLAGAAASAHLADNALLGALAGKVMLIDYHAEE